MFRSISAYLSQFPPPPPLPTLEPEVPPAPPLPTVPPAPPVEDDPPPEALETEAVTTAVDEESSEVEETFDSSFEQAAKERAHAQTIRIVLFIFVTFTVSYYVYSDVAYQL